VVGGNDRAHLASQQMILASEVHALRRAIQRDALNSVLDDPAQFGAFAASISKRSESMLQKPGALSRLFGEEDKAGMHGLMEMQEAVVREINGVTALARDGR